MKAPLIIPMDDMASHLFQPKGFCDCWHYPLMDHKLGVVSGLQTKWSVASYDG